MSSSNSSNDENVEGSVKFMLGEIRSDVKTLLQTSKGHDARLRSLERYKWGIAAVIGVFLALPKVQALAAAIGFR